MKAMIFAAGLGTRLKPLTDNKPKALVEIRDYPLLEIAVRKLKYFGFDEIIVNTHHFSESIINYLETKQNFGISMVVSDESRQLLGTGGGLKKASWFFNDGKPFLVYNVDVLTDLDLSNFYEEHLKFGGIVSLAVRQRKSSRYLLFNLENKLSGWKNTDEDEEIIKRNDKPLISFGFSGIHIIDPLIFNLMPAEKEFSIIDLYLNLAKDNDICAYRDDDSIWIDVGKKENLIEAEKIFDKIKFK